jgi:hypothetical protein
MPMGADQESSREFREWTNQSEKMIRVFRVNSRLIAFLTKFICGNLRRGALADCRALMAEC